MAGAVNEALRPIASFSIGGLAGSAQTLTLDASLWPNNRHNIARYQWNALFSDGTLVTVASADRRRRRSICCVAARDGEPGGDRRCRACGCQRPDVVDYRIKMAALAAPVAAVAAPDRLRQTEQTRWLRHGGGGGGAAVPSIISVCCCWLVVLLLAWRRQCSQCQQAAAAKSRRDVLVARSEYPASAGWCIDRCRF